MPHHIPASPPTPDEITRALRRRSVAPDHWKHVLNGRPHSEQEVRSDFDDIPCVVFGDRYLRAGPTPPDGLAISTTLGRALVERYPFDAHTQPATHAKGWRLSLTETPDEPFAAQVLYYDFDWHDVEPADDLFAYTAGVVRFFPDWYGIPGPNLLWSGRAGFVWADVLSRPITDRAEYEGIWRSRLEHLKKMFEPFLMEDATHGDGEASLFAPACVDILPSPYGLRRLCRVVRTDKPYDGRHSGRIYYNSNKRLDAATLEPVAPATTAEWADVSPQEAQLRAIRWKTKNVFGRYERRAHGTIESKAQALAQGADGRKRDLFKLAALAGSYIGAGLMNEEDVISRLEDAARAAGLSQGYARSTIANGLRRGKANPWSPKEVS